MKKCTKVSTKISLYFSALIILIGIIFYFLLPSLLNYPPDTINTQFDKEVSKLYYVFQYAIAICAILILFIIYFKFSLRKLDLWGKTKDVAIVPVVRKLCFIYPIRLFALIEIVPVFIVTITLMCTGSHPVILLFKIGILVFSFATLLASLFLIISKNVFYPILKETSFYIDNEKTFSKNTMVMRLVFQIFPSILVTALLIALIGYSRLIVEKGNLLNTYYMTELKSVSVSSASSVPLIKQLEDKLGSKLLSTNDFIFVESPNGDVETSNNCQVGHFFLKYMHDLSSSHDNRVYEAYTIDEQGVIDTIKYNGQDYVIGIHYEIVASSLLTYFLLSSGLLFIFNLVVLYYISKSIDRDLRNVTQGMHEILENKDSIDGARLPITSNDTVGELVNAFNDIQLLTKDNMDKIHNHQGMLMERERLASLGQLIGGIAHNLKTPIMSISGATEGLKDLVAEFDASVGNPVVNNDDFHAIASDMSEWLVKVQSYTEYMSDIITAVKGQAVTLSNEAEMSFTIGELFKTVNILMKHELKQAVVYLNVSMKVDENISIKGNVNSLVQVINNMISNSIQAYDGKSEQVIDLIASQNLGNIIITVRDYGPGIPDNVKDKLFKEMITTKGKNGTGLGLYMSYSTIRAHFNGNIQLDSSDNGTCFNIVLPL